MTEEEKKKHAALRQMAVNAQRTRQEILYNFVMLPAYQAAIEAERAAWIIFYDYDQQFDQLKGEENDD